MTPTPKPPTATHTVECPDCGGTGLVTGGGANYPGKRPVYGDCETCSGAGEIEIEPESDD